MVIPGEYLLFLALIFLHFPIQFETAKRGLEQLKKLIAAIGFDPMSFELWAQHASSAPSRFMVGVLIWLFTTSRSRVSSYLLLLWFAVVGASVFDVVLVLKASFGLLGGKKVLGLLGECWGASGAPLGTL